MSEFKRILFAGTGIALCATALLAGSAVRDRIDLGRDLLTQNRFPVEGLRADRSETIPVGEMAYFTQMTDLLKREYVEPIEDVQKLASGAVRGMIASLNDPESTFYDAKEFAAFLNARRGEYEGIGVDLVLVMESTEPGARTPAAMPDREEVQAGRVGGGRAPKLTVATVVPGGPADRAGVRPGDWVEFIDDHWVVNPEMLREIREFQQAVSTGKLKGEDLARRQAELRKRLDRSMLPLRARDKVFLGTSGDVKIGWRRGAEKRQTVITRSRSRRATFERVGEAVRISFVPGIADQVREILADRRQVTLDLRGNAYGDFEAMRQTLAVLGPSGDYGTIVTRREGEAPRKLKIEKGNPNPPQITLLVDRTTRGAAEIFALALSGKGVAKLSGTEMAGSRMVVGTVGLPDGSGYTLVMGEFKPSLPVRGGKR